jgi:hypothetical protein
MEIKELESIHHSRTSSIASQTVNRIGHGCGYVYWVANQRDDERNYTGVAFTLSDDSVGVKQRYAFIDKDDFTKTDDELVKDCAQQILGYPLFSKEDYQRRAAFTQNLVEKTKLELQVLQERLAGYENNLVWLNEKAQTVNDQP